MPTVSWILEGDVERFLEGTSFVAGPIPASPPMYSCPFCLAAFCSMIDLGDHLSKSHIGARPFLSFDGIEPASSDVVRTKLHSSSIFVQNATSVEFSRDGNLYERHDPRALPELLDDEREQRIWLRLENHFDPKAAPVRTEYDLRFRVYQTEQLTAIDRIFVQILGRADPSIGDADRFLQSSAAIGAEEYSGALADYVLGVLIKDGDPASGVRPASRDYRRKLNSALRTLNHFDRPLARLVAALIRFSSNDFSRLSHTGFPALDDANARLAPLSQHSCTIPSLISDQSKEERRSICPVDNGSDAVMRTADQLATLVRWGATVEDRLDAESSLASLDPLDRVKLLALWADAAIRLDKASSARKPLGMLVGNDCFGAWAERVLEEISG